MIEKDLTLLNDGSPTRVNKTTGNESTPDVTLCGPSWRNKVTWHVDESIGSSDHNPIIIEIQSKVRHVSPLDRTARWKSKDVDWDAFRKAVEEKMSPLQESDNIKVRVTAFNSALIECAEIHVGKTKPSRKPKAWMTPTVRAAVRKRNALRKKVRTQRKEWLDACKEAQEEITKAKEQSWKDLITPLHHLMKEKCGSSSSHLTVLLHPIAQTKLWSTREK